mmetsp:Transcript_27089/g.63320  ORF Transcript_27089/g.63320 Transcript_27089/m.63320 type:complete len:384 (-) Transcript_27089:238-1389(-)
MPAVVHRGAPAGLVRRRAGRVLSRVGVGRRASVRVAARVERGRGGLRVDRVGGGAAGEDRVELRPLPLFDVAVQQVGHGAGAEVHRAADADERDAEAEDHRDRGLVLGVVGVAASVRVGAHADVGQVGDVCRDHRSHQKVVAVLWVGRELKHSEDDDEDQRQGHERRRVVATVGIVEEHEDDAGDRHGEVGETEPEESIEPAAHLVDRVARQREQLLVESVRKVNQDDLLEHNHAKGANTSEPNIAVVVDDAVGYPDGGDQEPDVRDHLDIPAMVVDGWHEAREHRHERKEARRGEAHALGGGVLAAAWVARRRVLAAVRPCILRAGYVSHVVVVPILTADGHEEREHHQDEASYTPRTLGVALRPTAAAAAAAAAEARAACQ